MKPLLKEIRHNPLLWLLAFVPAVFVVEKLRADSHTLLFVLAVLAIVPLAALLSHATESVAAKTGDSVGGLLFVATIALLVPSGIAQADMVDAPEYVRKLSLCLAVLLIVTYALGMLFSLKTHREAFATARPSPARRPKAMTTENHGRSASRLPCSPASPCWSRWSVKFSSVPCSTRRFHSA